MVAKCIGTLEHYECSKGYELSWTKGPIHTLGITVSTNAGLSMTENVQPRIKGFDYLLNIWHPQG